MGIAIATTRTTMNPAGGVQNITTADLGGLTPAAAIFTYNYGVSDGTAADHAIMGCGAATATDERWAGCMKASHNANPTACVHRATTDECILILLPSGNVDGEADLTAWIANGCQITWGNAPAAAYYLEATFIAGTDLTALAGTLTLANILNGVTNVPCGFKPDSVLFWCGGYNEFFDDTSRVHGSFSDGVAIDDGSDTQASRVFQSANNVAGSQVQARIDDSYAAMGMTAGGGIRWAAEVTNFNAGGFDVVDRLMATNEVIGFLALNFGGAAQYNAGIVDSPTANGNKSWNEPGFQPWYVRIGLTQLTAIDTDTSTADAGAAGVAIFDEDDENCFSVADEDTAAPSDTQSLSTAQAVDFPDDDGTASWAASFVSFDGLGWTLNFTASEGTAVKWWYWALGPFTPYVHPTPAGPVAPAWTVPLTYPSTYMPTMLSVAYADPLVKSGRVGFLGTLQAEANACELEWGAVGGCISARLDLGVSRAEGEDWFEKGVGRHIEFWSPRLECVWDGIVNQVVLSAGQYAATRGPLTEVANRVYAIYSERDTTVTPSTVIPGLMTTIAQDLDSQGRYGIWEAKVDAGETDAAGAGYARDTWLREYKQPTSDDPRVVLEAGGQIQLSLECLGYWVWMMAYPYADATGGTVTAQTKVGLILAADPNGIFSLDLSHVDYNPDLAPRYENSETPAWEVVKALIARGDANDERWTFGIYPGRIAYYKKVPSKERYQHRLADPAQRIETIMGGDPAAWDVRPAQWLYVPDFLTGKGQPVQAADKRKDPRFIFIENVRYRAPYTVEITGTRVGKMAQILARQTGGTGG